MFMTREMVRVRRRSTGSSIAEFGPALWLLLICIFFPLLDLMSMLVSYGCCMVLNNIQVHEASLTKWTDAMSSTGPIIKALPDQWKAAGFGQYVKMVGDPQTTVSYRQGQTGSDQITDKIVIVQTTVTCSPFLPIPIPAVNVPGLNGPMTFNIVAERPVENPDYGQP